MNAHFKRHLVSNTVKVPNFTTVHLHATSLKNVPWVKSDNCPHLAVNFELSDFEHRDFEQFEAFSLEAVGGCSLEG